MKNKLILVLLVILILKLVTCSSSKSIMNNDNRLNKEIKKTKIKEHKSYKETFYFMPGIDDTCDTSLYNCIDMRSREYDLRLNKK